MTQITSIPLLESLYMTGVVFFLFCLFLYIYAKCVGGNVVDADICLIFVYDSTVF